MMFWFTALLSLSASAYIPEYATIASRAADQHGKGAYQIEQEVTFKKEAETFAVKETWLVLGENEMRLHLEGRGPLRGLVSGTVVYQGASKSLSDNGQNVRSVRLGEDWLEPLFHFRSSKWFRQRLVNLRVVPPESLKDRSPLNWDGIPKYEPPAFVRLSRTGGAVTWAVGMPPTNGIAPTLWLEQDQFVMRKYRGANQAVVKADDYTKYQDSFWYPRTRTYQFGAHTVTVQILQVRSLGKLAPNDIRFKPASLNPIKDAVKLPETDGLKEFYSRFR